MQQSPKKRDGRGAGPDGDPDTDDLRDDGEVVEVVIEESRPADRPRRRPEPAEPAHDSAAVPDGARSWKDRHGPTLYVVALIATLGVLTALQANC